MSFGFDDREYDPIIPRVYTSRSNAFWYGVVCGTCIATSAAMFMIVTRLLGIWT